MLLKIKTVDRHVFLYFRCHQMITLAWPKCHNFAVNQRRAKATKDASELEGGLEAVGDGKGLAGGSTNLIDHPFCVPPFLINPGHLSVKNVHALCFQVGNHIGDRAQFLSTVGQKTMGWGCLGRIGRVVHRGDKFARGQFGRA